MTATREGQDGKSSGGNGAAVRQPVGVGPEMAALGRFYRDVTWEGAIREGGMGPGAPAMTGVGRGTVQVIQDGRWTVLDCEQDQFLRNEMAVGDGSWFLIEEYRMVPR